MSTSSPETTKDNLINQELSTIAKGASFSFFGSIFGKGLNFIIIALITRTLGASLYGIYTLGLTIVSFISKFTSLGLSQGALKYIAAFRGEGDKRKTKGVILTAIFLPLIMGIGASFLIFFFASDIASFFNKPQLTQALKPFSIALPFLALLSTLSASTRGFKTTRYQVIGKVVVRDIVQLGFILVFYFLGYKLLGMIWAYIFGVIAGILVLFYYLNKLFPELTSKDIKPQFKTKKLFSVSLPLMYVGILSFLMSWTDILMVGYFLPSAKIGIYRVAVRVASLVTIFGSAFLSIFSPIISEYYQKNKLQELNKILKTISKWILILSLPIFLSILVSPNEILKVFGSNFTEGTIPLMILGIAQTFNILTFGVRASLSMTSKQNLNAIISIIAVISNIGFNYMFLAILNMGIIGAAIATTITFFIINGVGLFFASKKLNLNPISKKTFLILALAGISAIPSIVIKQNFFVNFHYFVNLIISSLFVILIFTILILFFGIESKDKLIFAKVLNKIKK